MATKKKKDKPIRIMTLDTETRGLDGAIFRAGLYDGRQYWAFDDIQDILQVIRNHSEKYKCHVYIHNADFDLSKFFQYIATDVDYSKSIFINNVAVVIPLSHSIIFHCSYRLLPSSLEKLSADFELEDEGKMSLDEVIKQQGYKDKSDYFKRVPANDPILNEYMEKDCTSLYKILMILIKISGLYTRDFVMCPTVASLAMKVYKEGYPDDYELATSSNYEGEAGRGAEMICRNAYYGGRTEVFIPVMEFGYHYDVNSLYPYVMKVHTFPYGWYEYHVQGDAEYMWKRWLENRDGAGIIHCLIEVPDNMFIPPLPYRQNGKLIFPTGMLEGYWVYEEIEMALRYGCKVQQIYSVLHFHKRAPIFEGYVLEMEAIKTKAEGAKREFAKLMQNSLYGKFGMERIRDTYANLSEMERLKEEGTPFHIIENKHFNTTFLETIAESKAKYIQPHIAAYVTAYARILLFESIMQTLGRGQKVAYCDTDSMVTDGELPLELVHDKEYGKWKLEYTFEDGLFFQPKMYYEHTHKIDKKTGQRIEVMKAKGIPKSRVKEFMNRERYRDIIDKTIAGEERYVLYDEEAKIPVTHKPKLGTSLKNDMDPNILVIVKKSLNLKADQKRKMDYVHETSSPLRVMDEIKLEGDDFQKWMKEQDVRLEREKKITAIVETFGKIAIPSKDSVWYERYKRLKAATKRKYFSRKESTSIEIYVREINEEFFWMSDVREYHDDWTEEYLFELIEDTEYFA